MSLNNMYYTLNEFLLVKSFDPFLLNTGGRIIIGSHDNQNTDNMPNSIRGRYIDGKLAGIEYADRQHSDTSRGKL